LRHNNIIRQAAKDVDASQEMLIDLFDRIENFFKRLESYTELPPSEAMADMMLKIMVEVLSVLAIATTEIKQNRRSESIVEYSFFVTDLPGEKFLKKLLGKNDIEDALKRLDTLTQEEARMATAEVLKVTHGVNAKLDTVITGRQCVRDITCFCAAAHNIQKQVKQRQRYKKQRAM
jgi:hypothetical protein